MDYTVRAAMELAPLVALVEQLEKQLRRAASPASMKEPGPAAPTIDNGPRDDEGGIQRKLARLNPPSDPTPLLAFDHVNGSNGALPDELPGAAENRWTRIFGR